MTKEIRLEVISHNYNKRKYSDFKYLLITTLLDKCQKLKNGFRL